MVICYKQRKKANIISHMELIGNVEGKNVILVDDMIDTGGTLSKAADLMMERGANFCDVQSVRTLCFLERLIERIENSSFNRVNCFRYNSFKTRCF